MPPKKSAPFLPPVQPLQTETKTKVQVESPVLLGTLTVCCLALLAVFGASFMQGIIGINLSLSTYYTAATIASTNPIAVSQITIPANSDTKILSFKLKPTIDNKLKVIKSIKFSLLAGSDIVTDSSNPLNPNLEFSLGLVDKLGISGEQNLGYAIIPVNGMKAATAKEIVFNLKDISLQTEKEFILHIIDHSNVSGSFNISTGYGRMTVWAGTTANDLKLAKVGGSSIIMGPSLRLSAVMCTDSDMAVGVVYSENYTGGPDHFILGTTYGMEESGAIVTKNDYCTNDNTWPNSNPSGVSGQYLVEYYCNRNKVYSVNVGCSNGCVNGACLRSYPVITMSSLPSTLLVDGVNTIAKFNIKANNGDVSWRRINLQYSKNANITLSDCSLYNSYYNTKIASAIISTSSIAIDLSAEQVIANDQSTVYAVRCLIEGTTSNNALATKIDGNFASIATAMSYIDLINAGENRFIWSNRSNISHSMNTNDWYGSINVNILPSNSWILYR